MQPKHLEQLDDIRRRKIELELRGQFDDVQRRKIELELLELLLSIALEVAASYTKSRYCILPRTEARDEFAQDCAYLAVPMWRKMVEKRAAEKPFVDAFLDDRGMVDEYRKFVLRKCDSERKARLRRHKEFTQNWPAIEAKPDDNPFNNPVENCLFHERSMMAINWMRTKSRPILEAIQKVSPDKQDQRALHYYVKSTIRGQASKRDVAKRFGMTNYKVGKLVDRCVKELDKRWEDLSGCHLRMMLIERI
jgi:hypothetical protein